MKYLKEKFLILSIIFSGVLFPSIIYSAQTQPPTALKNPIAHDDVVSFIVAVLKGLIKIGIPVIAIAVIYCGFLFVAARGNSEKLTKAKSAFFWTLIGAAILLGALALANLISDTVFSLSS